MSLPRPLDHLVLPVGDLPRARARLERLGFTVAPDARHPFGTGNCCVFFENGTYLEPLAVLDAEIARKSIEDGLFFVSRAAGYLGRRGEGFAMLALKSRDAEADRAAFAQAGISAGPGFRFTRQAVLPDGEAREIGVALAYAADEAAPDATLFACQHLAPEALWQPAYMRHANSALGVVGIAAVAASPADFHILVKDATGQPELRVTSFGMDADLGGALLSVLTPVAFQARYGVAPPDPGSGLLLAGFEVAVRDLEAIGSKALGIGVQRGDIMVVSPAPGLGAVLAFRSAP